MLGHEGMTEGPIYISDFNITKFQDEGKMRTRQRISIFEKEQRIITTSGAAGRQSERRCWQQPLLRMVQIQKIE